MLGHFFMGGQDAAPSQCNLADDFSVILGKFGFYK